MPIDRYSNSFKNLAAHDLPPLLTKLDKMVRNPYPMAKFGVDGVGVATIAKQLSLAGDFPGCYVLIEHEKPIYVGISRGVLQRLRQHVRGTTHFDASLAYRIASDQLPHKLTRSKAMEGDAFKKQFAASKSYLLGLDVAFVRIDNPLVLYVFEPYCAMHYDTAKWNTFETH